MKQLNARPDVQAKLIAFRASDRCPIKSPESRQRLIEVQRALGFPNLNYQGGPTVPQKLLFDALSDAVLEFKVKAGHGRTNSFRVDIAIPSARLAIEVDGLSHVRRKDKARDARKEQVLEERGWTLLRFKNQEIFDDLPSIVARIQERIAMLQGAA